MTTSSLFLGVLYHLALCTFAAGSYKLQLEGNVTSIFEDGESGQVVERQQSIGPREESMDRRLGFQASLHNNHSTNFMDRHEYHYEGVRYLAILASSSVLILRVEGTRTVYNLSIPLPSGCRPQYIQPQYSYGPGIFHVIFYSSCAPYYVDAPFNISYNSSDYHDGKKIITLDDKQKAFFVEIDNEGNLRIRNVDEGTDKALISPSSISPSCTVLRDFNPFRPFSGTNLALIIDCDSDTIPLRFVLFYRFSNRSILRIFPVGVATGVPLGNGDYLSVLHNNNLSLSIIDVNGNPSQTPVRTNFDTPVAHVKFLSSGNFTKLVLYQVGKNITLIDVPRFVASLGTEGKDEQPETVVHSCTPTCPAVEAMGEMFVMMTVLNLDTGFYDLVYRPLDSASTTGPVRFQGPPSQPVLTFVQTSLEVVPSTTTTPPPGHSSTTTDPMSDTTEPATSTEPASTTEPITEPATTDPITGTPTLPLALGIVGALLVVSLVTIALTCWLKFCHRKSRCTGMKINPEAPTPDPEALPPPPPPPYTPTAAVNNTSGSLTPESDLRTTTPSPLMESDDSSLSQIDVQSTVSEEVVEPTDAKNEGRAEAVILPMLLLPNSQSSSQTELPRATQRTPIRQETHNDSGFQSRSSLNTSDSPQPRSRIIHQNFDASLFQRSRTVEL